MDTYVLLKFAHVAAAIVWLGGGVAFLVLASASARKADPARLMTVVAQVAFLGQRLFMPASIVTLLTGLAAVHLGGFGWPAWAVLGLGGIAATMALGALKLGPMSEQITVTARRVGPDVARAHALELLRWVRFDYVLQFAIVFLMVVKPAWQDVQLLAGVGLAVLLAGFAILGLQPRTVIRP